MTGDRPAASPHPQAPLRIGYLVDSLTTGGAERLIVTFAEAIRARADVDLTVFVLDGRRTPFLDMLAAMDMRVVRLPGRGIGDVTRFLRLIRALRGQRLDYLHAHLTTSIVLGSTASRALGIPFAATIHNVRSSTRRVTRLRRAVYRRALRRRGIRRIAVGQAVADALGDDIGDRDRIVVANAIAPSSVAPPGTRSATRAALGLDDEAFVLVAVGTLIPQKGYLDLLEAFDGVASRHPEAVLLIVGATSQPEHADKLHRAAEDYRLGDRLRFLGLRGDVPELLTAGDLFVSASHWEGAPVALLEALANGLPCCVTDVGENALILEGTGAVVVPPGQPGLMAGAVSDLIADPAGRARIGAAGRERAVSRYGAAAWASRLIDLYRAHIGSPDAPRARAS